MVIGGGRGWKEQDVAKVGRDNNNNILLIVVPSKYVYLQNMYEEVLVNINI